MCAFNKKALVDALVRHQALDRITLSSTNSAMLSGTAIGQIVADDTRAGYEYLEKFFPVQVPVPKLDEVQIFPLSVLANLAKKNGSKSYSTDAEEDAVKNMIVKYGGSTD